MSTTRADGTPRIVITGAGWVTPLGSSIHGVWDALVEGKNAIHPVRRFDASTYATSFAAEVEEPDLRDYVREVPPGAERSEHTRFALAAASMAWKDAGLGDVAQGQNRPDGFEIPRRRVGVYFGFGEGTPDFESMCASNVTSWESESRSLDMRRWAESSARMMTRVGEESQEPSIALAHLARVFDVGGPSFNCMTACAASTQSIGEAFELLRAGRADVMIAGGAHTMIHPLGMTGFIRLTAMSTRNDEPETAPRPFDQTRDGFVMGEGAGVLVLETLEHAMRRGATPLAEIAGYGSSADAFRITDIQPDGMGAQEAMRDALDQAGIDPQARDESGRPLVHYISAHGTGTKENDSIESKAIRGVFGDVAHDVPVSSIKSMMGHLIQAAGAVECITCVQAIRTGVLPPTMNLHHPDPVCDLDYVPNASRDVNDRGGVRTTLSNSFGFGGQNNTIVLTRYDT
ncbi:MAG: beta-ketoacyl-[acyl-carrier-protein] synthase family protein [Phycisphaerales bacterium JB043]